LTALGGGCAAVGARRVIFEEAQRVAAATTRARYAFVERAALAALHAPALPMALEATREAIADLTRRESALDTFATLVGDDVHLFEELFVWASRNGAAYRWPARLAAASRTVAKADPSRVLRAALSVHPYYRALAHAMIAPHLDGAARAAATRTALEDDKDPSLGDARPFTLLAPLLDEAACLRAVDLASRLHPSPSAGAAAMAHLLPRLASFGRLDDALARARAIPTAPERGVALANVACHDPDPRAQEATILEAIALLAASGPSIALVAPALLPRGYGPFLLELRGAREAAALFAIVQAATGVERTEVASELARTGEPEWLVPLARELPTEVLAPRVDHAIRESETRPAGEILEDETGYGLVPWLPLIAVVHGDDAALAIARVLVT
jgi:hypothetical protein